MTEPELTPPKCATLHPATAGSIKIDFEIQSKEDAKEVALWLLESADRIYGKDHDRT